MRPEPGRRLCNVSGWTPRRDGRDWLTARIAQVQTAARRGCRAVVGLSVAALLFSSSLASSGPREPSMSRFKRAAWLLDAR